MPSPVIRLLFILGIVPFSGCAFGNSAVRMPAWYVENAAFIERSIGSTVLIEAVMDDDGGRPRHGGVGAVIDGGLILTAAHVVAGARTVTVHVRSFDPASLSITLGASVPAAVVASDDGADIAVLRTADASVLPAPMSLAGDREISEGQTVWFFGKSSACRFGTVTGTYASSHRPDRPLVEVSAASVDGDSGAPVVIPGRGLIGVLHGSSPDTETSYFVPVSRIVDNLGHHLLRQDVPQ